MNDTKWKTAYTGPLEHWLVEPAKFSMDKSYQFRVSAANSVGSGNFSQASRIVEFSFVASGAIDYMTIAIIAGCGIILIVAVASLIICICKRNMSKVKTHQFIVRGPDTELANLRELPHTAFQQSNTLYAIRSVGLHFSYEKNTTYN